MDIRGITVKLLIALASSLSSTVHAVQDRRLLVIGNRIDAIAAPPSISLSPRASTDSTLLYSVPFSAIYTHPRSGG